MANVKISDLTDGTAVNAGDLVEVERPGTPNVSRKVPLGTAAGSATTAFATAAQGTTADAALARSGGQMTGNITFSGAQTVDGRDLSADGTKLDGIESGADVTDATNVAAAGAVMESDTSTASMSFVIDEDNMASNSATKVPTQQSVKAYVDASVHDAVTVSDSSEIDFTLTGQQISASIVASSIDETKLDASVNASLDLADSALQSDDIGVLVQAYDADLATLASPTAWRVFYSNGSNAITELALGADGTFLKSNGATSAPSFATPAGSGDVSKVGTPVDNQIGVWTGDGTIEGDAALTFDASTDTLAIAASGSFAFGAVVILDDNAGTTTLQNIDALDATTEATIEAAIDTLANLTSVQGRTVTLADAGADALLGWDDSASAYQNLSAADARAALGLATTDNPQFATIELGAASDTTLSRSAAGRLAVEGVDVALLTASQTLTNKTLTDPAITGAILEDIFTITDAAGFEIDPSNGTIQQVTLGASRTPAATNFANGESVTLMVNDGSAFTITWTTVAVTWVGGSAPTLATSGWTVIELWKVGNTIYGSHTGNVS
jgi:hypothetical protein